MRKTTFAALILLASTAHAKPSWQTVRIPILPAGASLGRLWSGFSGDLYVWARTGGGGAPTAHLLHWDGKAWSVALKLAGHEPAGIFGTDARNMFAAANRCAAGRAAGCGPDRGGRAYRSVDNGKTWTPQALPMELGGRFIGDLAGSYENVQAVVDGASLLRFDGRAWSFVLSGDAAKDKGLVVTFQGANEGYMVGCRGWGRWVDGAWKVMPAEFGFCEARGIWGLRDKGGALRLYAVDDNRFSNGLRVWKFDPVGETFTVEAGEESSEDSGGATGLWGSAEDDVYAVGRVGSALTPGAGRIYRFDGTAWSKDATVPDIPAPLGIHGTSRNDVWVSLADGRLLHYSTATSLTRKMSGLTPEP